MKKKTLLSRGKKIEEVDITDFKLLPSAKPSLFHGHTVRKKVEYFWHKTIRPAVLEQQGRKCSVCGWMPVNDTEIKHLHLHEVEEYDFENKVCHLMDIELICHKCHSFHHIVRTKSVSSKEQWEDLIQHFIKVNNCAPEIANDFDMFISKTLQRKEKFKFRKPSSLDEIDEILEEMRALQAKPVRFLISPNVPFAEEITKKIEKKGLLYQPELQK